MKEDPTPLFDALAEDPGIADAAQEHADACRDCDCPPCAVGSALEILANMDESPADIVNAMCGDDRGDLFYLLAQAGRSALFLNGLMAYASTFLCFDEFGE